MTRPTATGGAANHLDMESSRLLCDDGHPASCRAGAAKSQGSRGDEGWTSTGLDAASRMRQEGRESAST